MKRQTIITIIEIIIFGITVAGSTYAFYTASISTKKNMLSASGSELTVNYTGQSSIDGPINVTNSRIEGQSATVNISLGENSVPAKASLFLNIQKIEKVAVEGFIWEVYGYLDGNSTPVYTDSGNFKDKSANSPNNVIEIVKDYQLSKTNTTFTIYLWIDGKKTGNEVVGGSFTGYISARSENYQANLQ